MGEFTYLFRGRNTSGSPEEMQKHFEKWVAWFKELGAKGHMTDPGHPLEATGKVVSGRQKTVNDGPYAEAKDVVGGYIINRALAELRAIPDSERLANYPFYHAAFAESELRSGLPESAREHFSAALRLSRNPMERQFFEQRLNACGNARSG